MASPTTEMVSPTTEALARAMAVAARVTAGVEAEAGAMAGARAAAGEGARAAVTGSNWQYRSAIWRAISLPTLAVSARRRSCFAWRRSAGYDPKP